MAYHTPRLKKWGTHIPCLPHQIAPMVTVLYNWLGMSLQDCYPTSTSGRKPKFQILYLTFTNRRSSANMSSNYLKVPQLMICTNLICQSLCTSIMPISCPIHLIDNFFHNCTTYIVIARGTSSLEKGVCHGRAAFDIIIQHKITFSLNTRNRPMNFAILPKFGNPSCYFVYDWLTQILSTLP